MPVTLEDLGDALTIAEAADVLHRDPKTVRRWVRDGDLDAIRVGAGPRGELRITRRALTAYLNRKHETNGKSA